MKEITIQELQDGYLLFLCGKTTLAKGIKLFQKWQFGKNSPYYLNHVGFFVQTKDGEWLVYEQDHPGRFQASPFTEEYIKSKDEVYVGIIKFKMPREALVKLRIEARKLAGEDVLLNYSYKSYFGFIFDTFTFKLFKKKSWLTGKPKGSTCSQITAKLYQKHFNLFLNKDCGNIILAN